LGRSSFRPRQPREKLITLIGLHASSRRRTMLFSSPGREAPAASESTLRQDELLDDRLPTTHARCRTSCKSKLSPGRRSHEQLAPGPRQPRFRGSSAPSRSRARGRAVLRRAQGEEPCALHAGAIYPRSLDPKPQPPTTVYPAADYDLPCSVADPPSPAAHPPRGCPCSERGYY
jgi:hypothetical protein